MADPKLYRRGPIWWARILGRRVSTGCKDRQAALLRARQLEREAADPAHRAAHPVTVEQALDAHLVAAEARGCAGGTLTMYREKAGHLIRLLGAATLLAAVDAGAVDSYVAHRQGEGAHPHTLAKELSTLRQTLKLAWRAGDYPRDPGSVLPARWASSYTPKTTWLTREQLTALCAALPPERAAYLLAWVATGCRESELYRLRPVDVDLAAGLVHVRGTKTEGAEADVPILPLFRPLLVQALRDAPGRDLALLFPTWGNSWRDIGAACVRAGVPVIGPHALRHTAGQWLRRAGVAPHLIGRFLRHTDSRMAERVYAPLDAGGLASLIGQAGVVSTPKRRRA